MAQAASTNAQVDALQEEVERLTRELAEARAAASRVPVGDVDGPVVTDAG